MIIDSGIYRIINLVTLDYYIGQSVCLSKREKVHFNSLRKNRHYNRHLQNSFNKYKEQNFKFEVLLYCEILELDRYEQALVDKWKPTYNICKECVSYAKGVIHSEESRIKLSESLSGRTLSREHRENLSNSHMGNKHSEETKRKMSEARKGVTGWWKGKNLSEETKLKMSKPRVKRYS